ncbi:thermonuclease family protein [Chlorobium sp.]|uniref:thermonuclease family protein n=1 Tax=Chlorobium sp. TaxID=1095 RepID=UPI0025B8093C|nr:thermonuclease family protein [Chlorobium sp.]
MVYPRFRCFVFFFLLIFLRISSAHALELEGRVVRVRDGDTIVMLDAGRELHVIRLAHIDTPEKNQPYGNRAKQFVSSLVYGKTVRIDVTDRDRYGRLIGVVYIGATNVNLQLVRHGYAWWYREYSRDVSYGRTELDAFERRSGLWADSRPVPPWEWRRKKREAS